MLHSAGSNKPGCLERRGTKGGNEQREEQIQQIFKDQPGHISIPPERFHIHQAGSRRRQRHTQCIDATVKPFANDGLITRELVSAGSLFRWNSGSATSSSLTLNCNPARTDTYRCGPAAGLL